MTRLYSNHEVNSAAGAKAGTVSDSGEIGSASVLEFTIVLPLCMFVVGALIIFGLYLCMYAVLDSAADRAVIIIRSIYSDPNYLKIADHGLDDSTFDYIGIKERRDLYGRCGSEPYRFLSGGYDREQAQQAAAKKVRNIIVKSSFLSIGQGAPEIDISFSEEAHLLGKRIYVTVSWKVHLPGLFGKLLGESSVAMKVSSEALLSCPPEMIRNTDFALDLVRRFSGVDIRDKIEGIASKVKSTLLVD